MNVKVIPVKMEEIAWTWWMVITASVSMGTTERNVNIVSIYTDKSTHVLSVSSVYGLQRNIIETS